MEIVNTNIDTLLAYRRVRDTDLFATDLGESQVRLSTQAQNGIVLAAETSNVDPRFIAVRPYVNKAIMFTNLMLRTHNFGIQSEWQGGDANYTLSPLPGYKLIITSIVTRLPEDLDLETNNMYFKVFKSYDGKNPVTDQHLPVVDDTYVRLKDLIMISNSPVDQILLTADGNTVPVMDIKFRYADDDTSNQSKLTLSHNLNERIEVNLQHPDQVPQRLNAAGIADPVYAWFNCKRVPDF